MHFSQNNFHISSRREDLLERLFFRNIQDELCICEKGSVRCAYLQQTW